MGLRLSTRLFCLGLVLFLPCVAVRAVWVSARPPSLETMVAQSAKQQASDVFDEEPLPADPGKRHARLEKNKRYNGGACDLTTLTADSVCIDQTWPRLSLVPIAESKVVVMGQVLRMQPYLSTDRRRIYTEITLRAEEVYKSPMNFKLSADRTLVIDLVGGALKLPSGQVVRDDTRIDFLNKPHVGGRYVLFAKGIHGGRDLSMIRGLELRDRRVFLLSEDGSPGTILVQQFPSEESLLDLLRAHATKEGGAKH
jgi:hypothetical protein